MTEINPVAWMADDGRIISGYTKRNSLPASTIPSFHIPLYDSAALAAARRDGEIAGMREAMEICNKHALRLSAGAGYAISFAVADINRAIQEKSE